MYLLVNLPTLAVRIARMMLVTAMLCARVIVSTRTAGHGAKSKHNGCFL
jgi:hypothetical protein